MARTRMPPSGKIPVSTAALRTTSTTACMSTQGSRLAEYSMVKCGMGGSLPYRFLLSDYHVAPRVPAYIGGRKMASAGADQRAEVRVDTRSLAVVDGKFGSGQAVAPQAVKIGIQKCKASGLAAVALRNAGHIGRVGDWAEMAAAEGLVSVHFVNAAGSVLVAPYGGVERRMAPAPYCVGIPRQGQGPIVLDFDASIVAEGKVLVASRRGKKLPKGALIDLDATLSEDPEVLYGPHTAEGPRDHG